MMCWPTAHRKPRKYCAGPSCAAPRVHIVHRGVVVQMKQLKVNFCAVELPRVVVRSLRNIQAARKELLPTTTNLPTAAALAFQIKLREICLNEIRVIRARLSAKQIERCHRLANAVSDRRTKDASFRSRESKAHRICAGQRTNGAPRTQNRVCGPQVLS